MTNEQLDAHLMGFEKYTRATPGTTGSRRLCFELVRWAWQEFHILPASTSPTPPAKSSLLYGTDEAPNFASITTVNSDRTALRVDLIGPPDQHDRRIDPLLVPARRPFIRIEIQSDADMPIARDAIRRAYQLSKAKTDEKRVRQLRRGSRGG